MPLRLLAFAIVVLALAGCRGDDEPEPPLDIRSQPVEYRGAYAICSIGSVRYVAQRYGVAEATPEAVADAACEGGRQHLAEERRARPPRLSRRDRRPRASAAGQRSPLTVRRCPVH